MFAGDIIWEQGEVTSFRVAGGGVSILSSIQSSAIDAVIHSALHSVLNAVLHSVLHSVLPHLPSFIIPI